jgi:ribosomal protein S18 acetylase RimI-like enzyme
MNNADFGSETECAMSNRNAPVQVHGLIIRQVKQEDLTGLEWEGEYAHFRRLYIEAFRRAEKGEAVLWVAELDRTVLIGQLFVHLESQRHDLADGHTQAYIYGFRVRTAYRGKGIGTYMLQMAEQDLIQRGYLRVVLNVGRENMPARRLYERNGYAVIGTDPGRWSYLDDQGVLREVNEPAWRMEKVLIRNII